MENRAGAGGGGRGQGQKRGWYSLDVCSDVQPRVVWADSNTLPHVPADGEQCLSAGEAPPCPVWLRPRGNWTQRPGGGLVTAADL